METREFAGAQDLGIGRSARASDTGQIGRTGCIAPVGIARTGCIVHTGAISRTCYVASTNCIGATGCAERIGHTNFIARTYRTANYGRLAASRRAPRRNAAGS